MHQFMCFSNLPLPLSILMVAWPMSLSVVQVIATASPSLSDATSTLVTPVRQVIYIDMQRFAGVMKSLLQQTRQGTSVSCARLYQSKRTLMGQSPWHLNRLGRQRLHTVSASTQRQRHGMFRHSIHY